VHHGNKFNQQEGVCPPLLNTAVESPTDFDLIVSNSLKQSATCI